MEFRYKHRAWPTVLVIDADTPEDARTFLVRVVRDKELWSKV